ncbi:hypothetical protein JHK87_006262 [Glycine soja]|nr:hypothetical protein JHK87_006262 [Glycine soja]
MLFAKTAIAVLGDLADTLGNNTGPLIQQKAETILTQTDYVHKEFMSLQEEADLTQEEIMSKWFTEDVFAEAAEEGDLRRIRVKMKWIYMSLRRSYPLPKRDRYLAENVKRNEDERVTCRDRYQTNVNPSRDLHE